jgi:3-oxoacyl-[acyl-carrier protein] reductase
MDTLSGKLVLSVGGSRGIGKAIALACGRAGAKVAVVARDGVVRLPGTVGETADEIRRAGGTAQGFVCDIADGPAVRAMVSDVEKALGPIDIVINSAATFIYMSTAETSDADWDRVFSVNTRGAFLVTRAVLPSMIARQTGHIIHLTGSGARHVQHMPAVTGASKAALERFALGLAHEMKPQEIAVNLFDPGPVKTERSLALRGETFDWTGFAMPSEVAPAAVHLAGLTASQATGQIFCYQEYTRGVRLGA